MIPELKKNIAPRLQKLQKGKSCFYVREVDDDLLSEIKAALDLAVKEYQKKEWL